MIRGGSPATAALRQGAQRPFPRRRRPRQTAWVTTDASPYTRLGGRDGIDRLISGFYERVQADPNLAPFFVDADMGHLLAMQHEFVAAALGGPEEVAPSTIQHAHHGRGIKARHFVRFLDHFLESLSGAGLTQDEIDRVLDRMAVAAPDVIDETSEDG